MNKHYHFEGHLSLTGSNADERFTHRPSETGAVVLALAAAVGVPVTASSVDGKLQTCLLYTSVYSNATFFFFIIYY